MLIYSFRKLLLSLILIVVVLIINFFILRLTPGNPLETQQIVALQARQGKDLTAQQQEQLADLRDRLSLYFDPAPQAFGQWIGGLIKFDFGNSVITGTSFTRNLVEAAISSFWLLLLATMFGGGVGIGLGVYAAYRPGSWQDNIIKILTLVFIALPGWYLLAVFYRTGLFRGSFIFDPPWNNFLPVFAVSVILIALIWGQTRSQVITTLKQDYIRTARAKGLLQGQVLTRHVMCNSLTPLLSIFGNLLPFLLTSQLLIELLTGWQGLGNFFYDAALVRDYTKLMGVFSFLVIFCVLCSYLADLGQVWLDPKLKERYQGGLRASRYLSEIATEATSLQKIRNWKVPVPVTLAVLIVAVLGAFFLGRETAPRPVTSPVADDSAAQTAPSGTAVAGTPAITFEQVPMPDDAQVLITDTIEKGIRSRIIAAIIVARKPNFTLEPAQDADKRSTRTIFSTATPAADYAKEFDTDLQGKGWKLAQWYRNTSVFSYIYVKADRYIWLSGDFTYTEYGGVFRHLTKYDPATLDAINLSGKVIPGGGEVIQLVQGFKVPDKDFIRQDLTDSL